MGGKVQSCFAPQEVFQMNLLTLWNRATHGLPFLSSNQELLGRCLSLCFMTFWKKSELPHNNNARQTGHCCLYIHMSFGMVR